MYNCMMQHRLRRILASFEQCRGAVAQHFRSYRPTRAAKEDERRIV